MEFHQLAKMLKKMVEDLKMLKGLVEMMVMMIVLVILMQKVKVKEKML